MSANLRFLLTVPFLACLWLTAVWGAPAADQRPATAVLFEPSVSSAVSSSSVSSSMSSNEVSPPQRHRRAAMAQVIDMAQVQNPCSLEPEPTTAGTPTPPEVGECGGMANVLGNARITRVRLDDLQERLGPSNCQGMSLAPLSSSSPNLLPGMTTVDKMKAIYKSLVLHAAYMHAIASQRAGTEMNDIFQSCAAVIQTLQCSLKCNSGILDSELTDTLSAAAAIEVSTGQDSSSQLTRDCLVIRSTLQLLEQLLALPTQG